MAEEELLKNRPDGEREGQKPEKQSAVEQLRDLTDAEVDQVVQAAVSAAETTFVEAPGAARTAAVEHLHGDTSQAEATRTSYRQRMANIRSWLTQKLRGVEAATFEQPADTFVPGGEPTQPAATAAQPAELPSEPAVTFPAVDGVHLPRVEEPAVSVASETELPSEPVIDDAALRTNVKAVDLGPKGPDASVHVRGTLEPEPSLEKGARSLRDEVADIIRKYPEQFDILTDTAPDPRPREQKEKLTPAEQVAEVELKQAALLYELYDLAGYIPALSEARDNAMPNLEWCRDVINQGKPNLAEGAPAGDVIYPDIFTPEQLAQAVTESAEQQAADAQTLFGGTFDDWVHKSAGSMAVQSVETATQPLRGLKLKTEARAALTTLGLDQGWRVGKWLAGAAIKTPASILKAAWVVGTRFGSAGLEKMRRSKLDTTYPSVVKSADTISRGTDMLRKVNRIQEIQGKLHALGRDRARLLRGQPMSAVERLQFETPANDDAAVEQMVYRQLWQEVCDQAHQQNKDAVAQRLQADARSVPELFLQDTDTGALRLNATDLSVSFSHEQLRPMIERARTMRANRPAIRDVCRKYLGAELQRAGHGLSRAGLQALQRGKFLFESRVDGSLEVELLLDPVNQRRRSEFDEDSYTETTNNSGSLHMTIPADLVERMLAESTAGNYKENQRVLNDEALNRVFEGDITEPDSQAELGQTMQTEDALANLKKLMDQAGSATQTVLAQPTEANTLALKETYRAIQKQYAPDQLGMEVRLPDEQQQIQYEQFVLNLTKVDELIQATLTAQKELETERKKPAPKEPDEQTAAQERMAQLTKTYNEALKTIGTFYQSRSQEFTVWHPLALQTHNQHLTDKFTELVNQAAERPIRYAVGSVLTLPGRAVNRREPMDWVVQQAKNGIYVLEHQGKLMVMPENTIANWVGIASKQAKAAVRAAQPKPFRMPQAA